MVLRLTTFVSAALMATSLHAAHAAIAYSTPPASTGLAAYTSTITINLDGSTTTTGGGPAFGGEDSFIHVINNAATTVGGLTLSGTGIFNFDNDGTLGGTTDPADYSGSLTSFTFSASDLDNGRVTFVGGLASGADSFFELEEDITAANSGFKVGGTTGSGTTVPEPAAMAILATGLFAMGLARSRARG